MPAVFGQFHMRRGKKVVLSEGMRVASVEGSSFLVGSVQIAFSNNPIPTGLQFSVKVLQEGELYVSPLIQTFAVCPAWIAHTDDSYSLQLATSP